MPDVAFDTLKAAEALAEAGIEERHARAIASTMRDAITEGVATKGDLKAAVASLKAALAGLKADIANVKWVLGFLSALVIAMAARLFGAF